GDRRQPGAGRPRVLAGVADRGGADRDGPPARRSDRPARGAVPDAGDVSVGSGRTGDVSRRVCSPRPPSDSRRRFARIIMSDFPYPAELAIAPLAKPPSATVTVPGSKSITNRALVLAALGSWVHDITLTGALRSEDTEVMVGGLRELGYEIETDWPTVRLRQ